jgi:hypothetical protein
MGNIEAVCTVAQVFERRSDKLCASFPLFLLAFSLFLLNSFLPLTESYVTRAIDERYVHRRLPHSISANHILKQLRPHLLPSFLSSSTSFLLLPSLSIPIISSSALKRTSHEAVSFQPNKSAQLR